ncbi:Ldh family oxidoreductase [Rhodococcus sp. IEGM 1330]|uniref:Ldh family oxidoreductase n=1 Tax=Rhodococcus sp. IEGM 1330 TaxID=3082225 RepID=UPI002953BE4D|nr:Ldh family oxidoreductase [Rhodococcus sp. IEGM 1330]MDV8025324.1 Ldh family oxidoreductase [Rhodococcus sp. IEGM 1330]
MNETELRDLTVRVLERHGANCEAARLQADALVEGELRAHPSHGLRRLPLIVERMRRGLIDVTAVLSLDWTAEASLKVDGNMGFGPVALHAAIDAVSARAERTGIAMAAISRSSHIGMLAPYVERVARQGCIGLLLTTSEALVHAWGGRSRAVGTNPIGVGIPTSNEPLSLDMSTSAVSMGKIIDYAAKGRPLRDGWATDRNGEPTENASEAAAFGALSPFGGPKGYALGVTIESLVATVTQTAYGADVLGTLDSEHPVTKGDLLIVISLDVLGLKPVLPLLTNYLIQIRASGGASTPVDVPGDRARRTQAERRAHGVPVDSAVWANVHRLAEGSEFE